MSKDFSNPTRININNPYVGNLNTYGDNWFYTEFQQSGKAIFEVVPSNGLSVNLYIYDRNDNNLAISTNGGQGQAERIEYNVSAGQWIRMDVQYSSGSGSFSLSCKMQSGGTVTPNAKEIKDNDYNPAVNISQGQEHWYYVRFNDDGKANFYVEPLNSTLDVDIIVYKGSTSGEVVGQSARGAGQWDLVEKKPVQAGIKYYIKIKGYSGSGQYKVRCRNYTLTNKIKKVGLQTMKLNLLKDGLDKISSIKTVKVYHPEDYEGKIYRYFHKDTTDNELLTDDYFNNLVSLKTKLFGKDVGKISSYFAEYYFPKGGTRAEIERGKGYFRGLHEGFDMSNYDGCKFYAFGKGTVVYYGPGTTYNMIAVEYDSLPNYRVCYLHASELNDKLYKGATVGTTTDNKWLGKQGAKGGGSSHVHWEIRNSGTLSSPASSLGNDKVDNPDPKNLIKRLM